MVQYHPINAKDQSSFKVGKKVVPSIFFGYALYAGAIWKGDFCVAAVEELKNLDASEIHARRLNAKEVLMQRNGAEFVFPLADRSVKLAR